MANEDNRLYVSPLKVIVSFVIVALVVMGAIYGMAGSKTWPPKWQDYLLLGIWVVSSLIFGILSFKANYYILEHDKIVQHRFNKEYELPYSEIWYIDTKWSEKHKTALVFTSKGSERYLAFDKEGILYKNIIKNAKNLMTKEEYKTKFPTAKV